MSTKEKAVSNSILSGENSSICSNLITRLTLSYPVRLNHQTIVKYSITEISNNVYRKSQPFLRYDIDPYIILHDGRIKWMIDAYTITHRYPYSVSMQEYVKNRRQMASTQQDGRQWGNYIRNSVKVLVDAYDGTVDFYIVEREQDPIAECYRKIFPDLFKPFSEMPEELKAHIRYPTSMFRIQAHVFQEYHMKEPVTFYAKRGQMGYRQRTL